MSDNSPQLLDFQTVAAQCSVSPFTVRKWVKEGKLRPIRICRRLLFHPIELARFINEAR
jgi:hypothetical protein